MKIPCELSWCLRCSRGVPLKTIKNENKLLIARSMIFWLQFLFSFPQSHIHTYEYVKRYSLCLNLRKKKQTKTHIGNNNSSFLTFTYMEINTIIYVKFNYIRFHMSDVCVFASKQNITRENKRIRIKNKTQTRSVVLLILYKSYSCFVSFPFIVNSYSLWL